jgi:hypothetical protein
MLYAHLAGLKAAQQFAQAGQYIESRISRSRRHYRQFLGSGYCPSEGSSWCSDNARTGYLEATCLATFQKSGQYALDGAEGATPGSSA